MPYIVILTTVIIPIIRYLGGAVIAALVFHKMYNDVWPIITSMHSLLSTTPNFGTGGDMTMASHVWDYLGLKDNLLLIVSCYMAQFALRMTLWAWRAFARKLV